MPFALFPRCDAPCQTLPLSRLDSTTPATFLPTCPRFIPICPDYTLCDTFCTFCPSFILSCTDHARHPSSLSSAIETHIGPAQHASFPLYIHSFLTSSDVIVHDFIPTHRTICHVYLRYTYCSYCMCIDDDALLRVSTPPISDCFEETGKASRHLQSPAHT
jgi:hypothetical protein